MNQKRRVFIIILLLILSISPSLTLAEFDYDSQEVFDVMRHLDMQGHADDDFSTCGMQQMYYEEIKEMLDEGMTEAEIIESYVAEFGQAALREPGGDRSGIIAWVMPLVIFLFGIIIVVFGLKKLTRPTEATKEEQKVDKLSETEAEVLSKVFEEERRKHF